MKTCEGECTCPYILPTGHCDHRDVKLVLDYSCYLNIFSKEERWAQATGKPLRIQKKKLASFPCETCSPTKKNTYTDQKSSRVKMSNKRTTSTSNMEYKNNDGQISLKQKRKEKRHNIKGIPKYISLTLRL